ncbi:MAG: hypothetical protein KDC53_05875, partial [Saprospiraceae bacterium]|nr:hypothetical protein [Saprospiraceae bacterium]
LKAYISDLGDLHNYYGYEEFNAEGYDVQYEKLYSTPFDDLSVLKKKGISGLLEKGYTTFILKSMPSADIASDLPFRIIAATTKYISPKVITGSNPVLTFWKNGTVESILVNGKISTLKEINESLK